MHEKTRTLDFDREVYLKTTSRGVCPRYPTFSGDWNKYTN